MNRNVLLVIAVLALLAGALAIASSPRTAVPVHAPEPVVIGPAVVAPAQTEKFSVCGVSMSRRDENTGNDGTVVVTGDVSAYYHIGGLVAVVRPNRTLHWSHVTQLEVAPATEGNFSGYTKVYLDKPYHDPVIAPSALLLPAK